MISRENVKQIKQKTKCVPAGTPPPIHCRINAEEGTWKYQNPIFYFCIWKKTKHEGLRYVKGFAQIGNFFKNGLLKANYHPLNC